MKLMYSPTSPFARRVRVAAAELGLGERLQLEVVHVAPGRENAHFAATVNPLRKIPALLLEDGATVLFDSTVICEYLDHLGGGRLIPAGAARWPVLTRQSLALGMTEALVLSRYENSLRPEGLRWSQWTQDQEDRFWRGLDWFERQAPTLLTGARALDLAQIALACCLGYADFRFGSFNWPVRAPGVAAWYRGFAARPSMAATVPPA
ncbi:MAG: glutathione S-transferase [Proteobacteria bacterium]|nr:glutathione S-transferase [Pseudomonadota bacterium]